MTEEEYGTGPVKVFVLSVTKPVGSVGTDAGCKSITKGDHGTESDNDLHYLKNEFINKLAEKPNVFECRVDATVDQFWKDLDLFKDDKKFPFENYKCFIFVFFTYMSSMNGDISDEQIHLKDGKIPISKIWDKLKMVRGMVGCPKIFLVQADDLSLLREPQGDKGPPPSPPKKIPQEADRLTILSTIPSNVTSKGILKAEMKNKSSNEVTPSLLMEAFVDAVKENDKRMNGDKLDMLSLTIDINRKVDENLEELKKMNTVPTDLPIPLITSTLSKFLYLPKLKEDEDEGTPV